MLQESSTVFSGSIGANGARSGQLITGTANSTNVLDSRQSGLPAGADLGIDGPWLVVIASQAFNNLTSLSIALTSDSNSNLATSPVTHLTKTVALAGLTAGAVLLRIRLPSDTYKEYVGLIYTINGAAPSTGAVFAFLTPTAEGQAADASAFKLDA